MKNNARCIISREPSRARGGNRHRNRNIARGPPFDPESGNHGYGYRERMAIASCVELLFFLNCVSLRSLSFFELCALSFFIYFFCFFFCTIPNEKSHASTSCNESHAERRALQKGRNCAADRLDEGSASATDSRNSRGKSLRVDADC